MCHSEHTEPQHLSGTGRPPALVHTVLSTLTQAATNILHRKLQVARPGPDACKASCTTLASATTSAANARRPRCMAATALEATTFTTLPAWRAVSSLLSAGACKLSVQL